MEEDNHIPEIDLKLAQKVGSMLDEKRSVLSANDFLIDQIVEHKRILYQQCEVELSESKRTSWEKIHSSIQQQKKSEIPGNNQPVIHRLSQSNSTIWKVAAVFILAAFLSVFLLRQNVNQPELLVQANNDLLSYTLTDGSQVQLRPHSTLYIVNQTDNEVRYKLEGEAFFDVTKNPARHFLVDAGPGKIEVMGTSFDIREWGEETIVYLEEGSLRLSNPDGSEEVLLEPGEAATATKDFTVTAPVKTDGAEYLSWQHNEIIFENRKAESIIKELEQHYSIKIIAPDSVKNEILGGTLSLENRSVSLENLGIVLGGKFSSIENDTYQFVE